jgi:hypothetical protein
MKNYFIFDISTSSHLKEELDNFKIALENCIVQGQVICLKNEFYLDLPD